MNQSNKGRELSNEDVGVTLPFKRLVSSMVTIIVSGLIPVCILVFLFAWMAGLLPKTFLAALLVFCTVPVFSWSLYFLYLLVTVLVTKGFLNYYNKKSPAEPGVLVRQFKDRTHPDYRKLHYYHMRGAIIKYSSPAKRSGKSRGRS